MLKKLNEVRNVKDPLKMFDATWSIAFNGTLGTYLGQEVGKDLELRCQTFDFPKLNGDKTVVNIGGFERTYAGKQTRQGDWTVTFTEVWDSSITEVFKKWLNRYHNYQNGTISLLDEYTATVRVNLLNPDVYDPKPEGITSYNLDLYDVFPTNVSYPNINASSSEAITITTTFHYNFFLMGDEIAGA